ncbi:unnamed protein product [Acanthoscelides obtectus]|uniref:Uncharacterized protein n=1 Tax=Acanthoscelides obtectus TaxID=200917 RepID=A0A9P0KN82_ACAOB|nr:unnamed protein product [Acanthoscelides obtectus]CAK1641786.1 hypothetical protein AOBTE_LOCUS12629 [Acanthoscelides obtectus]
MQAKVFTAINNVPVGFCDLRQIFAVSVWLTTVLGSCYHRLLIDFRLCLWSVHEQKGFWRLLAKMMNRIMFILRKKSGLCRCPLFQVTIFLI